MKGSQRAVVAGWSHSWLSADRTSNRSPPRPATASTRNSGTKAYEEEGFAGVRKMMAFWGGGEDPQVAWRYKQLSLLPEGTIGREFWEHCARNRFSVPGEKGGIPARAS